MRASLLFGLVLLAGCTASPSANPHYDHCTGDGDCPAGQVCVRGFCVGGMDAGASCRTEDVCYEGADGTLDQGVCRAGCMRELEGERVCVGQVLPGEEECNGADDDCDGSTDEGFALDTPAQCGACGVACTDAEMCCEGRDGGLECANVTSSRDHCGACGAACPGSEECCGSDCADLTRDPANCGACGNACAAGQICCDSRCVDPRGSNEHCGACGNACAGTDESTCCIADGDPTPDCRPRAGCATCDDCDDPGELCCGGACVDSRNDPANCGGCGVACEAGQLCCDGMCRTPEEACGSCATACTAGQLCCDGMCRGVTDDRANCGGCGVVCASNQECCNGECVNLQTDNENCGACGMTCIGTVCAMGTCCPAGHIPCPGRGCVPLGTETDCATCGNACNGPLCNCQRSGSSHRCGGVCL